MAYIIFIIEETLKLMSEDTNLYDHTKYICRGADHLQGDEKDKVQGCVHAVIRTMLCRLHRDGILSPLYHSKAGKICKHRENCPFVIAFSMYLWLVNRVGFQFDPETPNGPLKHPKEGLDCEGSGCSFMHVTEVREGDTINVIHHHMETRKIVFDYLEEHFGTTPLTHTYIYYIFRKAYFFVMNLMKNDYQHSKPGSMQTGHIFAMNLTANEKHSRIADYHDIIVPNDSIFYQSVPQTKELTFNRSSNIPKKPVVMSANDKAFRHRLPGYEDDDESSEELEMNEGDDDL